MPELAPEVWALIVGAAVLVLGAGAAALRRGSRPVVEEIAEVEAGPPSRPEPAPDASQGLAARFFEGLARSRSALASGLQAIVGGETVDEEALESLEDALIAADLGVRTAGQLVEVVRGAAAADATPDALRDALRSELLARIAADANLAQVDSGPLVILVVGVNGSGKTTTIGKLAARYVRAGNKVMLAAGDTFRAGAIEQLKVWGQRAEVPVVAHQEGGDPAAVIFDATQAAVARGVDVLICDTAGRLQAQQPLMDELGKVVRVMRKALPDAPHEVLLVLDATIGQNAIAQATVFKEVVGVTGVALTKLDGTAKGGVVVAVGERLGIPVKLVGLGEGIDDLRDFHAEAFVDALLG